MTDAGPASLWLGTRWPLLPVKRLFRIVGGATPPDQAGLWGGSIVWITPEDMGRLPRREIETSARKLTPSGYASCGTELVAAGSIVLSTRAPIGYVGIATVPLCSNQGCKSLEPRVALDSRFYHYVLLSLRPLLVSLGAGSTFRELRRTDLGNMVVPAPPWTVQRDVADFLDRELDAQDELAGSIGRQLALLSERRAALIAAAITGREGTSGD